MPFLVLSLILLISTPSFCQTLNESTDQVWEVGDRRWTIEEERRFEKWGAGSGDSIAFIEKTCGKKDPKYADFSIRQQRHFLAKLSEEWSRSGCKEPFPMLVKKEQVLTLPKEVIQVRYGPCSFRAGPNCY